MLCVRKQHWEIISHYSLDLSITMNILKLAVLPIYKWIEIGIDTRLIYDQK